jgi:transcriptional regulator with XRE-family HTH domain
VAKRGPKSKFNEKLREAFVRLAREGKTLEQIAEVCGVSKRTLTNWMGANKDLLLAVREARQVADELVEAALFSRAMGYSHPEEKIFCSDGQVVRAETQKHYAPDTQAAMFWLRNRQPKRWREKNDADVNVNNNFGTLTDEQLEARIQKQLKKLEGAKE